MDPDGDREGLQRAALDREIRARIWKALRTAEQATNSVDQIVLTPDVRAVWIKTIYADGDQNLWLGTDFGYVLRGHVLIPLAINRILVPEFCGGCMPLAGVGPFGRLRAGPRPHKR